MAMPADDDEVRERQPRRCGAALRLNVSPSLSGPPHLLGFGGPLPRLILDVRIGSDIAHVKA
jgi:hypothetical protein